MKKYGIRLEVRESEDSIEIEDNPALWQKALAESKSVARS
jgi:hypothetical protein